MYYSLRKYKKKGYYDIMTYISEHVILVQLLDSLGNLNRAIIVFGYWILVSNLKQHLYLIENRWIWFVPLLLVKKKLLCLKQYLLQWDSFCEQRTKEGVILIYQFNNWFISNIFGILKTILLYYVAYIFILENIKFMMKKEINK